MGRGSDPRSMEVIRLTSGPAAARPAGRTRHLPLPNQGTETISVLRYTDTIKIVSVSVYMCSKGIPYVARDPGVHKVDANSTNPRYANCGGAGKPSGDVHSQSQNRGALRVSDK